MEECVLVGSTPNILEVDELHNITYGKVELSLDRKHPNIEKSLRKKR